jgi:hypothetical protein
MDVIIEKFCLFVALTFPADAPVKYLLPVVAFVAVGSHCWLVSFVDLLPRRWFGRLLFPALFVTVVPDGYLLPGWNGLPTRITAFKHRIGVFPPWVHGLFVFPGRSPQF